MTARDGVTLVKDSIEFGLGWQVLPSEGRLFHSPGSVQAPHKCAMPTESKSRRLGASTVSQEAAAIACASVSKDNFDACIFDVIATNDEGMAAAY